MLHHRVGKSLLLCRPFSSSSASASLPTPLKSRHEALGGQMVDFAGYTLPVLYKNAGVLKEHIHTREEASVFDVSHMGQIKVKGKNSLSFLEKLTVADLGPLAKQASTLTVFMNEAGGVIDDAIITKIADDDFHIVVNGACKAKDLQQMKKYRKDFPGVSLEMLEDSTTLVALQGPKAAAALEKLLPQSVDLKQMKFMTCIEQVDVGGVMCRLSRCGYTGEDGFEISALKHGGKMFDTLLSIKSVLPAGLGARDSLRLEAGLCLYGHELNDGISPIEANLNWLISKRRREQGGFLGAQRVMDELKKGKTERKRIGLVVTGAPARETTKVYFNDKVVGEVTSGTFSPTLKQPIAMAYVNTENAALGTVLEVEVRGKKNKAVVSKMPFVKTNYFKGV